MFLLARSPITAIFLTVFLSSGCVRLMSVEWNYDWSLDEVPAAEIEPLLYGKQWAYAVQIDDNPVEIRTVALEFFAGYQFTDAPPGIDGGRPKPFVGDAAVFLYVLGANSSYLDADQIVELLNAGWGLSNHSYFHRGRTWGDPPEILTDEELREGLFWSQSIFAHDFGNGRAPTHFVFPNGYLDFRRFFDEFGILSGSSYAAAGGVNLFDPTTEVELLSRANLDEGRWKSTGQDDPLFMFPMGGEVVPGLLQIDFTHGMSEDPNSDTIRRWKARMDHIAGKYGAGGDDSVWCAPVSSIIHYRKAAVAAELKFSEDGLSVRLPDEAPGSPLTVRVKGVPEPVELPVPEGGVLYRKGETVWITTPMLGKPGTAPPKPMISSLYSGPVGKREFAEPIELAGVQVFHRGNAKEPKEIELVLTLEDGRSRLIGPEIIKSGWSNGYLLFSLLPNEESVRVKAIEVPKMPILKTMRVWGVE